MPADITNNSLWVFLEGTYETFGYPDSLFPKSFVASLPDDESFVNAANLDEDTLDTLTTQHGIAEGTLESVWKAYGYGVKDTYSDDWEVFSDPTIAAKRYLEIAKDDYDFEDPKDRIEFESLKEGIDDWIAKQGPPEHLRPARF